MRLTAILLLVAILGGACQSGRGRSSDDPTGRGDEANETHWEPPPALVHTSGFDGSFRPGCWRVETDEELTELVELRNLVLNDEDIARVRAPVAFFYLANVGVRTTFVIDGIHAGDHETLLRVTTSGPESGDVTLPAFEERGVLVNLPRGTGDARAVGDWEIGCPRGLPPV